MLSLMGLRTLSPAVHCRDYHLASLGQQVKTLCSISDSTHLDPIGKTCASLPRSGDSLYKGGREALSLISQGLQHGSGELLKAPGMEAKPSSPHLPPYLDAIVSLMGALKWEGLLLDGQGLVCADFG